MATKIGCKRDEPRKGLKTRRPLRPVSNKRARDNRELREIVSELRSKCGDVSELGGVMTYIRNGHRTEPHHLSGRSGEHLINPFEIIMIYANQHDAIEATKTHDSQKALMEFIKPVRIGQGYKPQAKVYGREWRD